LLVHAHASVPSLESATICKLSGGDVGLARARGAESATICKRRPWLGRVPSARDGLQTQNQQAICKREQARVTPNFAGPTANTLPIHADGL